MVTIRSWKETTGVDLFLIDITEKEKSLGLSFLSKLFDDLENEISIHAHELSCANAYMGANADGHEHELIEFFASKDYKNILTIAEMRIDLNDWQENEILRDDPCTIEKLRPEDIESIWSLNNNVYSGREFIPTCDEDDYQEFASKISSEESVCFVARVHEEMVGFVWAVADDKSAEIVEVSILNEYRRRGIARVLLRRVLVDLKNCGIKDVWLETNANDPYGARSLYSSFGFVVTKKYLRFRKSVQ